MERFISSLRNIKVRLNRVRDDNNVSGDSLLEMRFFGFLFK